MWILIILCGAISLAEPIGDIGDILALSEAQSREALPVSLEAVVTYVDPRGRDFFLQQPDGAGISMAYPRQWRRVRRGDRIQVTTVTAPGDFAPRLADEGSAMKMLAHDQPLVEASLSYLDVLKGTHDCKFVSVEGMIRRVLDDEERLTVSLDTVFGTIRVYFPIGYAPEEGFAAQIGDLVRVRGVIATNLTENRHYSGVRLYSQEAEDITVLRTEPVLEQIPLRPLSDILRYDAESWRVFAQFRTRVTVVAQLSERIFFAQDGDSQTVYVQLVESQTLSVGSRVELLGFPSTHQGIEALMDTRVLSVQPGPRPEPLRLRRGGRFREEESNLRFVEVDVEVVDVLRRGDEWLVIGRPKRGLVEIRNLDPERNQELVPGARIRAQGINILFPTVYNQVWGVVAVDFREEVTILSPAPLLSARQWILVLVGALLLSLLGVFLSRVERSRLARLVAQRTAALAASRDRLIASKRLRNRLVQLAAHDIFSPLTVIVLHAEMLQTSPLASAKNSGDQIQAAVQNIRDLINQRLREPVNQVEPLDLQQFDLRPVLDASMKKIQPRLALRNQVLNVALPASLLGWGDPMLLSSAFLNLVDNAAKYGPPNAAIHVEGEIDDVWVRVRVRDEGPGVPPSLREAVLQGASSGAVLPDMEFSSGQGLQLTSLMLGAMGGQLLLEDISRGASFIILLPRTLPDTAASPPLSES